MITLLLLITTALAAPRVVTLQDALTAATDHPQVRQADALASQADARARQSLAALLPRFSGTAAFNLSFDMFDLRDDDTGGVVIPGGAGNTVIGAGGTFGDPSTQWTGRVTGNQLLFGLEAPYTWLASRKTAEAAEADADTTALQVGLAVRRAYFAAVAAKALVQVAEETLANEERHLAQAQAFVEIGTRPPIDVAEARRTRATARMLLVQSQGTYAASKAVLAQAMGVTDELDFDVAADVFPPIDVEEQTIDALAEIAWSDRPDVRAIDERLGAQMYAIRAADGAMAPSLSLTTIVSTDGKTPDTLRGTMSAGVGLSFPIVQGGSLHAIARQQRWALAALEAQRDQLRLQVRTDVAQARVAVATQRATVEAAQEVVDASLAEQRLAEGRYQEGVGSAIELFNARIAVRNALGQQVQAVYDLATARAQLAAALGRP